MSPLPEMHASSSFRSQLVRRRSACRSQVSSTFLRRKHFPSMATSGRRFFLHLRFLSPLLLAPRLSALIQNPIALNRWFPTFKLSLIRSHVSNKRSRQFFEKRISSHVPRHEFVTSRFIYNQWAGPIISCLHMGQGLIVKAH